MGYYTHYTLEINDNQKQVPSCTHKPKDVKYCPECGIAVGTVNLKDKVVQYLKDNYSDSGSGYDLAEIVDEYSDGWKWYEHEQTMRDISRVFPSVLFTLIGEGEESGDVWRKYFMDGKMQVSKAVISFEDFDEKKLT